VLGVRSRIGKDVRMKEAMLLGADQIETDGQRRDNALRGIPSVEVGEGSVISRAILDKDCRIGRGVQIINRSQMLNGEGEYHVIRDGIVVIPNGTVIPDGTVI
jgi:glucose-1-phosphate adenylyltransferase